MEEKDFTYKFPEWVLSYSLSKAYESNKLIFWEKFWERKVHPANGFNHPKTFSDLYPSFPIESLILEPERPFQKNEAGLYGIDPADYEKTFWGLRPDFVIHDKEQSLIILLEAKGGLVPDKVWRDPKELRYYDFLCKCRFLHKGFYYIVPQKSYEACKACLGNRSYFEPHEGILTGLIFWEDLLPIIYEKILETTVDEVSKQMEGLKELREWRKNYKKLPM